MAVRHEDYPHPVPAIASLHWKENWLFVIMAVEEKLFDVVHINTGPAFDRTRSHATSTSAAVSTTMLPKQNIPIILHFRLKSAADRCESAKLFAAGFLYGSEQSVAGVVNKDVYPAEARFGRGDDRPKIGLVYNIEGKRGRRSGVGCHQIRNALRFAPSS